MNKICSIGGEEGYIQWVYLHKKGKTENYKTINTRSVKQLEKRLRRLQRQVSRKYEMNKEGKTLVKTSNILKI